MLNFNECDFKTINHIEPPLLKPACDYAKQGISVFPCCHEGEGVKKPVIGGGFKSASTNAEQVNAWWIEHPMALIGAPTGEPMGAFVLDIDVKANENGYDTLADLEAKHGALPSTRQVTTPSGGAHLYFLHPGSGTKVKNSVRKLGPGLDIRGDGGYVILPPSKIGEDSYELVIDAPIAPAPQWLLDLVCPKILPETSNRPTPKQGHKAPSASGNIALPCTTSVVTATRYGAAALKNECAKVENAQVGRRNDQLNRSAFALGRLVAGNEVSHELAVEMLKPAAQKCGLPDSEITKTIECGLEAGKKSPLRKTGVASPYLESGNSGKTGRIQPVNGLEIGSVQQESVPEAQAYPEEALLTPVIPDGYVITESGTFAIEYKKGEPIHVYLGPPLEFVGLFHNSSFDGWGVVVRWNDIDGHPKTHSFEHAALCDSRQSWRAEMSDRGWPGDPAPKARQLLAKLMLRATPPKRILAANQVGWCGDCFVLPDESVIGDQEKEVILRGPDKDLTFEMKGSLEGWSTTIGKLCRGNSRLLFAVCASLSAPLLKLINGDGGGFHYFGDSSSGKTTTLFVGMSVWASPQAIRSWRTTANGVEGVLALHNNLTLCLDEVGEADSRDVGEIVYKIGNGQGKTRMNAEAKLKKTDKWLCQVLSTGENAIVDVIMAGSGQYKAGQEVRFIDLPADPGKGLGVFEHLHDHRTPGEFSGSIKQACHENYGGLGRAFVSKVTEKMQDLKIELRGTRENGRGVQSKTATQNNGKRPPRTL